MQINTPDFVLILKGDSNKMWKKKKVLVISSKIPSALVGVIAPLKILKKRNIINFELVLPSHNILKNLDSDILVCIRGAYPEDVKIIEAYKQIGKKVIYYLDDDLLNLPVSARSYHIYNNPLIRDSIYACMKLSDCLWTPSIFIENKYGHLFEKTIKTPGVAMLLNLMNFYPLVKKEKEIIIGFSGGIDHESFLEEFLEKPLKKIKKKYNGIVSFEFIGAKPGYINSLDIEHIPWQESHKQYGKILVSRQWDIGLAPLPDTEFHRCKHYNKFLDYGAIGIAGVYSNLHPYKQVVVNKVNGMLASNHTDEWVNTISYLIEHRDVLEKIKVTAKRQIESEFSATKIAEILLSQIKVFLE